MNIKTPYDVLNKTCWLFLASGAKSHTGERFECGKLLARISAVNADTVTARDSENKPRLFRLSDIERIAQVNEETHVAFMQTQLESALCNLLKQLN